MLWLLEPRRLSAPSGGSWMSAIPPLSGDKETFGEQAEKTAHDPKRSSVILRTCLGKAKCGGMNDFVQALAMATRLIGHLDAELRGIVLLSLGVSLTASLIAFSIGAPLGTALAIYRFPGKSALIVFANALLGLPPVVVGLAVYLFLSRSGPLGSLGILFTPTAMIIAQAILGVPIVVALAHRIMVDLWAIYGDALLVDGASRLRAMGPLMRTGREGLLTAFLAAFGRAIAEVGAIIIVGGNIRGYTRTMTTAIALETSKGDLSFALALGIILVILSMTVSALSFLLGRALIGR